MKLQGQSLSAPVDYVVIPRPGGKQLVFKFTPVLDDADFLALCPRPLPPKKRLPGRDQPIDDVKDSTFQTEVQKWAENKINWLFLQSISATEGLEWEKVKLNDSETWSKYQEELKESGFNIAEITSLINKAAEICGLTSDRIREATDSFLASLQAQQDSTQ